MYEEYMLLSMQTALLGKVIPQLRAVTIDFNEYEETMVLHFFYDAEIDDRLFDLASVTSVEIELGPNFRSVYTMNSDIAITLKYPKKIPIQGDLVYLRNEKNIDQYLKKKKQFLIHKQYPFSALRLYAQQALLGKITPNLRSIGVEFNANKKEISFYFSYDGEVAKVDYDLAFSIVKESTTAFSDFSIHQQIRRIDFPEEIIGKGERLVYLRNEE